MRQLSFPGLALILLALAGGLAPGDLAAQQIAVPEISAEKLAVYASAYTEIASVRDQYHTQFARPGNKTHEAQAELRKKLREEVLRIIEEKGLTEEEYQRITWAISVDPEQMEAFSLLLERQPGSSPQ